MPEEKDVRADDSHHQGEDIQHRDCSSMHMRSLSARIAASVKEGAVGGSQRYRLHRGGDPPSGAAPNDATGVSWVDGAGAGNVSAAASDNADRNFRELDGASLCRRSMQVQQAARRCAVGLAVLPITAVGGCGSTPISSSESPSQGRTTATVAPKSADRSSLGAQPSEVIDFTPVSASETWAVTAHTGSANRGIERPGSAEAVGDSPPGAVIAAERSSPSSANKQSRVAVSLPSLPQTNLPVVLFDTKVR